MGNLDIEATCCKPEETQSSYKQSTQTIIPMKPVLSTSSETTTSTFDTDISSGHKFQAEKYPQWFAVIAGPNFLYSILK